MADNVRQLVDPVELRMSRPRDGRDVVALGEEVIFDPGRDSRTVAEEEERAREVRRRVRHDVGDFEGL